MSHMSRNWTTKQGPSCKHSFEHCLTWKGRCFHLYLLGSNRRCIHTPSKHLEKTKIRCRRTKPVLPWLNQFKACHTIGFTILTFIPSKKHIYSIYFWLKRSFKFYHKIKQKISFQDCFLSINHFFHPPKNTIIMVTLRLIKTICIFRISD